MPGKPEPGSPQDQWWQSVRRLVLRALDALESTCRDDPEFIEDLNRLLVGPTGNAAPAAPRPDDGASAQPQPLRPPPRMLLKPAAAPLIGPRVVAPPPPPSYPPEWTLGPFDPAGVSERCRLKARAARWQTERSERLDNGEDVAEGDAEIQRAAREGGVFLWMISPQRWRERTPRNVEVVAGCYDALAEAAELMGAADRLQREQEAAMKLLGEAQSSVRAAVEDFASTRRDQDQEQVFAWLRRETDARRVYVEYMQLDNPASPHNHADLRRRIASVRESLDQRRERDHSIARAIQKVRYHANKLSQRAGNDPVSGEDHDFRAIAAAVESLLRYGVAPTDPRLREALLPAIDAFPPVGDDDDSVVPAPLARALAAAQDFVDQREAEDQREPAAAADGEEAPPDPLIAEARRRAGDREAVLIGGVPSEPHRLRLLRGLSLRSLEWIRVEHHEPFDRAESVIRRPGVNLVIIMTRWRSHRDGPAARNLCRELGIPLVELPAGYNLRQVAHRIVAQMPEPSPAVPAQASA